MAIAASLAGTFAPAFRSPPLLPSVVDEPLGGFEGMLDSVALTGLVAPSPGRGALSQPRGDQLELSGLGGKDFLLRASLMEVEFESVRAVQGANGGRLIERSRFLHQRFELEVRAEDPEGLDRALEALRDHFSPEKTAQRIFDFATSHYGRTEDFDGDNPEARERYRDYILPAIQRGFEEARAILGTLPPEVEDVVSSTFDRILELFRAFVEGEGAPEPSKVA